MLEQLKKDVCQANLELQKQNLVIYSFGNVSGIDRQKGIIAIKSSGVPYSQLTPEKIVLLDLDCEVVEGDLNPSSDTPTHLELYKNFQSIGGICHTHSTYATMWAQSGKELPCFGTTHADYFYGSIPITQSMTDKEIQNDYELNTGKVIAKRFKDLNPDHMPAVLVAHHGPFTWGPSPAKAVETAIILENCAKMALGALLINPDSQQISQTLLDKHYLRKHGKNAYYGQK
ncbi:MAG: L-ribulose-5-phosphate 4-epimerase [Planctomycetota bacterium]|jgi:L-ribulose-5-phosphate 4-epimerase